MKRARILSPWLFMLCGLIWLACGALTPGLLGAMQLLMGAVMLAIGAIERWALPTAQQELFRRVRDYLVERAIHHVMGEIPSFGRTNDLLEEVDRHCGDAVDSSKERT